MRIFYRAIIFTLSLELFLRIGSLVSISIQNFESKSNLEEKNLYRIMCIGESITFSGGKDSYPSQLEKILNEGRVGGKFEVINRGIPGSDSADIAANLSKEIDLYKPNMVIAMVGINDDVNTPIYKDSLGDKLRVYIGGVRVLRIWKFLWAHIITEVNNLFGEDHKHPSIQNKLKHEIRIHPKGAGAYIELGQYLIEQKNYKEAEALFKKAIRTNPKKDWGYEQLAKIYILQGQSELAANLLVKSLELNSKKSWAYASLSRFYKSQHREKDAESILQKGIRKNPNDTDIYVELGSLYCKQSQFQRAIDTFQEAIHIAPNNAGIYSQLGFCYGEQKQYKVMETLFEKAVSLGNSNLFLDLSDWYMKHDQAVRAEAVLKRALLMRPDETRIIRGLSNIYAQLGNGALADEYQRKAEELSEKNPLEATTKNYRKIVKTVQAKGVSMVVVSYAMRDTASLKQMLKGLEGIIFINNGAVFKEALINGKYEDYFTDSFAGDLGHCTPKGAYLLAKNIAKNILKQVQSSDSKNKNSL